VAWYPDQDLDSLLLKSPSDLIRDFLLSYQPLLYQGVQIPDSPGSDQCHKPCTHLGRLCPRLGGASSGLIVDNKDLKWEPNMPMETMLSELVLLALLLAVVVLSGKV